MKTILFLIAALCLTLLHLGHSCVFGQDVLVKREGGEIKAKVLETNTMTVKYLRVIADSSLSQPVMDTVPSVISASQLLMIRFADGHTQYFDPAPQQDPVPVVVARPQTGTQDMYLKGRADAMTYYKGYKGAATGTLVTGLLSPLVGLIPAIACSSTRPLEQNLNIPNAELAQSRNYVAGYQQQALQMKSRRVWTNWGIAFGVNLVAALIILN
jgi:hypothetical protein